MWNAILKKVEFMNISTDYNLKLNNHFFNLADFPDFVKFLEISLAEVLDKAPSNSFFTVTADIEDAFYIVKIKLASENLIVEETGAGQTPYYALDSAILKINQDLDFWSFNKS